MKEFDLTELLFDLCSGAGVSGNRDAADEKAPVTISFKAGDMTGSPTLPVTDAGEAIVRIQAFIDEYLKGHQGEVDYIHGDDTLLQLSQADGCAGLLLPAIGKDGFFANIMKSGVYPRKTFSVGEAQDKRYYLEVRRLYE